MDTWKMSQIATCCKWATYEGMMLLNYRHSWLQWAAIQVSRLGHDIPKHLSTKREKKKKVKQPSLSLKDMLFEMVGCLKKTVNWSRTGQEMDWHKHGKKQDGARRFCIKQVIPQIAKTKVISVYAPCIMECLWIPPAVTL